MDAYAEGWTVAAVVTAVWNLKPGKDTHVL